MVEMRKAKFISNIRTKMPNYKFLLGLILVFCLISVTYLPVHAQDEAFGIHVRKDFGYNMGRNIQGRFTISLRGVDTQVESVTFLMDGIELEQVNAAPFRYQFSTDDFEPGVHRLAAQVKLKGGSVITTSTATFEFLSRDESGKQVTTLLVGIGGAALLSILVVGVVQVSMLKGTKKRPLQPGERRSYGLFGGTVCPKCGRAFPRHFWGINLVVGRLDRCEHCGKWVMTIRATPIALQLAEQAESDAAQVESDAKPGPSAEQDSLEDTKYIDSL